jgi:hypothetical protein
MSFSKFTTWFAILFEIFMKKYQVKGSEFFQSTASVICFTENTTAEAQSRMDSQQTFPVFDKSTVSGFTYKEGVWSMNTNVFKEGVMIYSVNEKDLYFIDADRNLLNISYTTNASA